MKADEMNNTEFNASWGRRLSVTSGIVTLILILFILDTIAKAPRMDSETILWRSGLAVFIGVTSALFYIRKYSVHSDAIKIHHPGWTASLKIKDLTGVEKVPVEGRVGFGFFGIWGIYSFSGIARNGVYGFHRRYLTNSLHPVALKFGNKTVMLSPDDPDAFISTIQSRFSQLDESQTSQPLNTCDETNAQGGAGED